MNILFIIGTIIIFSSLYFFITVISERNDCHLDLVNYYLSCVKGTSEKALYILVGILLVVSGLIVTNYSKNN